MYLNKNECRWKTCRKECDTYLLLLLVKVVNNDTNEEVECEERAEDDEDDKVNVHVEVDLIRRLLLYLRKQQNI